MSANVLVPATWPLGYELDCPACGVQHEVDEVDLADPAAHPYDHPVFGRMFNFECPECHTQNGVKFDATAPASGTQAIEVERAYASPPGFPVAEASLTPEPETGAIVTGEDTTPYEDGAHS